MVDVEKLIRPHLMSVQTYDPVDPPELLAKQAGIPEDQIVKLNGNENPYGGSPKAIEAVANTPLHIYPDPLQRKIRQALSEYTGASVESIIVGAGADELIDLLLRMFLGPGENIIIFSFFSKSYCFGSSTQKEAESMGLVVDIPAPTEKAPSMTKAISDHIKGAKNNT